MNVEKKNYAALIIMENMVQRVGHCSVFENVYFEIVQVVKILMIKYLFSLESVLLTLFKL